MKRSEWIEDILEIKLPEHGINALGWGRGSSMDDSGSWFLTKRHVTQKVKGHMFDLGYFEYQAPKGQNFKESFW